MMHYRRKPADTTVLATALGAGAAAGAAVFYLAKLWLQREPMDLPAATVEKPGTSDPATSEGAESSR